MPCTSARHLAGQRALRAALFRRGRVLLRERVDLLALEEREPLQERHHVGVVDVDPVLIERVRARAVSGEPYGALFGLADLLAVAAREQRRGDAVRLAGLGVATELVVDQIDAGDDVAVLIGARDLHRAAERAAQVQEVVCLQQHVAELGVADALLAVLQALAHRVLLDHRVHGEVLAGIAQHLDEAELLEPVGVVQQQRAGRRARVEIEEALEHAALPGDVGFDLLARSSSWRSASLPEGSPIMPVPPPISAIGRWPAR